ncbi:MAG: primosomal protein N' [Burkholderiales bacterium]
MTAAKPTIARIVLDVPLDSLFDYRAEGLAEDDIGRRVLVSFGRRRAVGVIVGLADRSGVAENKLKPVLHVFRDLPPLPADILHLLRFCADYYQHPLGEVVLNALPQRARRSEAIAAPPPQCFLLSASGREIRLDDLPARASVQRRLLLRLQQGALCRAELADFGSQGSKVLRDFIARGWAEAATMTPSVPLAPTTAALPELNPAQAEAVQRILAETDAFHPWLLHGITGSGKTEVYLRLIESILAGNGQVLVLVPEINLTPQLEERIRRRFPRQNRVSLHSGLNETERLSHWQQAAEGRTDIVLGTRLAVFTPLPRLKLIIVDEEHDSSYKQQDGLRYSARDVAVMRARERNIPIVLGSATPALETWHNSQSGRYALLELPERAAYQATPPTVHLIDTRRAKPEQGLSAPLLRAIAERLERGEQSLVFINRRGFSPVLMCNACGWLSSCPRCSSKLVVHLRERQLRCHHCGHETRIPASCPDCGNTDLSPVGHGTQRVEEVLAEHFPSARILRIDRDSTRRRHSLSAMLAQVHDDEVDILVGTQLLAKGHDFPKLTLVGILNADGALYSTDFRASERLFAQLLQVTGRAGRASLPGEVLIQTDFPAHDLYLTLQRHDYNAFADSLLAERRQADFPPFCFQALLRAEATQLSEAMAFLAKAVKAGLSLSRSVTLYDPVPAQMTRLAGRERAQLLVQADSRKILHDFLQAWLAGLREKASQRVRWSIDVDPLDFY